MIEIAGFDLLPPAPLFMAFALAGLALNLVPGADMAYVTAASARSGLRAGIVAALGVGSGALVHILLAVVGVSAVIASSPLLFEAVKWLGVAYLLYLAVSLVRERGTTPGADPGKQSMAALGDIFRGAALVNILNPKVALFFVAFLPQFIDPGAVSRTLQLLTLGLWFNLVGTIVNCLVAVLAAGASRRLRQLPWIGTAARWFAAVMFVGLAARLLLARRAVTG